MKRVEVGITDAEDEELKRISEGMGLSLSLDEMRRVKQYFVTRNREPTDVELQSIAQAWSEHCCYKSSKKVLEEFIFEIEAPQNILVIKEDAAVLEFDEEHAYVFAFESHNHPSAIEPYGGAATGIGGIIRDVVCMGAQPVALIDPLFFGPLDYPDEKLPEEVKHPRFLFTGVVAGISDYGNRIGIPTCAGMIYFHEGYVGNCVVNVGCVGIMKKADLRRSMARTGEVLVLVGGKTGRDGIHGVTFASVELTGEEEFRSAVQLGDPITKEPLMHAILEAVEKGLISGMKDLGGGGLSCAVSEMCHAGGCGAEVHLEQVKLKEEGLSAWEIWVSESQERFLITTEPDKVGELLELFERWDVDATVIGQTKPFFKTFKKSFIKNASQKESFTKEENYSPAPLITIFYDNEKVFELETDFLLSCPRYVRPREVRRKEREGLVEIEEPEDYTEILKLVLASPNIASREFVIRQYDHEVRASTVFKPMQGLIGKETHGDAAVIKPLEGSYKGLAITSDVNPSFCRLNPFWGAASAMDEVCRNLTSVGAVPHSFADCLNFGNPEKPDRMGEFYECCRGLGYMASTLRIPFVSGNVSFYNESAAMRTSIPPTPTILGIGLCDDVRKCITVDVKEVGNFLYLVGETKEEFGGSEYYKVRRVAGGIVPRTNPEVLRRGMEALREAMGKGLIASCHDVSEGGLAVTVCEMVLGGDIGASIDIAGITPNKPLLSLLGSRERGQSPRLRVSPSGACGGTGGARDGAEPHMRSDYMLFSESNTRWVVEVWRDEKGRFEELMNTRGICIAKIGETIGEKRVLMRDGGKQLVDISLEEVRKAWTGKIG
ncbi:MAG: phosphoribosylformylglycinamidine synthase subunit PurL [Methanophagales archaeon]|nr:phosphoribosylformylglycinamidine synthase subunit PurL [Methanophagales archaeon]